MKGLTITEPFTLHITPQTPVDVYDTRYTTIPLRRLLYIVRQGTRAVGQGNRDTHYTELLTIVVFVLYL